MKTIVREKYLERIKALKDTPDIKIITGIRRCGKSNLMQAYINYLKSVFEDVNIIFIDFMDLEFEEIKEYHTLHKYVEDILKSTCFHSVLRSIVNIIVTKLTRTNCLKNISSRVVWQVHMCTTLTWIEQLI